ncbi:hypothetical protein SAMN02745664_1443, partial [Moraxella cuniculi DSM 21768]
ELNAQVVITTEFGKEAPKRIGDYAQNKELELRAQGNTEEANKWAEGGIYRIALHTITAALATGTIEGAVSAGTTAYTIPKLDEYLTKQGYTKQVRDTTLLALSATLGTTIGDSTASTVNNVGQTRWNYLSHWENAKLKELKAKKQKLSNAYGYCISSECAEISKQITELEQLSKQRDQEFDTAYANCRAGIDCNQFYYLHVIQRNEWNKEAEKSFKENRNDWILMKDSENIFHNFNNQGIPEKMPNGSYGYKKFVHNNGQMEIIIDTKDGILSTDDYNRIVRDPTNAGTYNYYGPKQDGLGHKRYDVDPYIDFGNGLGDETGLGNRRSVPAILHLNSGKIFGKLPMPTNNPKTLRANRVINQKIKIAHDAFDEAEKLCEANKDNCNYEK